MKTNPFGIRGVLDLQGFDLLRGSRGKPGSKDVDVAIRSSAVSWNSEGRTLFNSAEFVSSPQAPLEFPVAGRCPKDREAIGEHFLTAWRVVVYGEPVPGGFHICLIQLFDVLET
eukprot:Plantae.Rhodophyta-Rhodochaete_pulchella.ctg18124.p1 GENE.Plantae.Rhodophyta-Rhodochaete_pulchella.ctg18124~~Plantae.Rhodophyta-Rhodochaete_pulchella.ctg18124.p1  ORF type:complete len:114 (-),score=12.14 Plantae.Rhodophyta-Rhodochaete_pulchella.ctg18124:246-587(-)